MKYLRGVLHGTKWIVVHGLPNIASGPSEQYVMGFNGKLEAKAVN